MLEPSTELVREFKLKSKIAVICNAQLKSYAKKKEKINQGKMFGSICSEFIKAKVLSPKYAIYLLIIFGKEFGLIKQRIINKELDLNHISSEDYWEKGTTNIGIVESIFFSYTYHSESYPELLILLEEIEQKIITECNFDIIAFIENHNNFI